MKSISGSTSCYIRSVLVGGWDNGRPLHTCLMFSTHSAFACDLVVIFIAENLRSVNQFLCVCRTKYL